MDALDLDVRRHVYFSVVAHGRPPTTSETAEAFGLPEHEIAGAYRRLHDAHALVLFPGSTEIQMANPFCFAPTPHRVKAGGKTWTGTCCWDALGIPAALHADGEIATECACCGEPLRLAVRSGELVEGAGILCHILVPAVAGGTTSASPEARWPTSGRRNTWRGGSMRMAGSAARPLRRRR